MVEVPPRLTRPCTSRLLNGGTTSARPFSSQKKNDAGEYRVYLQALAP
jgi:hypothetical protein